MNILIVANHYAVCSARYAADAFTRLGHTVRHVGPPKGRDIWGLTLPTEYVWEPDGTLSDYGYLASLSPDLVIVMDSDPDILDWAGNASYFVAPTVVWGVDSHVRRYERPDFKAYFLAHKSVSIQPYDDKTFWLPCAYDPTIFTSSTIPWNERKYDVCMIGVMYPQRWALVQAMHAAGLKVLAGTGLVYEQCAAAYQNSRVSLCASAAGDLAQRVFETAACGCAVLSDPLADLNLMGSHPINFYADIADAVGMAETLQDFPETAPLSIKWAAPHTWDARAQVIIDWYQQKYASEGAR